MLDPAEGSNKKTLSDFIQDQVAHLQTARSCVHDLKIHPILCNFVHNGNQLLTNADMLREPSDRFGQRQVQRLMLMTNRV